MTAHSSAHHLQTLAFLPTVSTSDAIARLPATQKAWALTVEAMGDLVWIAERRGVAGEFTFIYASARLVEWLREGIVAGEGASLVSTAIDATDASVDQDDPRDQEFELVAGAQSCRWIRERRVNLSAVASLETSEPPSRSRLVAAVLEDVTDRRLAHATLANALQAQHRARLDAERLSASKDEFISVVSHDLRSPLNAIRGWAHVLKLSSHLTAAQERALDAIDRNITAQARMVDDLLDSQRILRGKLTLAFGKPALADLVEEAVETIRVAAETKRITIDVGHDRSIGAIEADVERLRQAFANLLSNSLKFTSDDGQIVVNTARVKAVSGGTDILRVTLSDTGMGLDAEQLEHMFDPVIRADQPGGRRQGGLNLPLSLARQLIELHGGTVRAHSEGIDAGLTMIIDLPETQQGRQSRM